MYAKSALVLAWLVCSYVALVFFTSNIVLAAGLIVSLGLAMAAVGFNIQHDGGHAAYSERPWLNKLCAMTLDLIGGSSYVWARKHNSAHHSFANVTGHDDDVDIGWLGRLTPHQKRLFFHRFQHYYLWLLYGFLPIKWHVYDDFRDVARGRIGEHKFRRPRGWDLVLLLGGKLTFATLAFVLPAMFHSLWVVLIGYVAACFVEGLALSIVFQLAHCVDQADFPLPHAQTGRMRSDWAAHQVQTTVDFAPGNRWLTWYVGGLNFQVEHHLFPQICHVHYPGLAPVVRQTCESFGLPYKVHASLSAALASHFRWLKAMGAKA